MLFLFRPYQLLGVKGKLVLVSILVYFLDALYRVALQALRIPKDSTEHFVSYQHMLASLLLNKALLLPIKET